MLRLRRVYTIGTVLTKNRNRPDFLSMGAAPTFLLAALILPLFATPALFADDLTSGDLRMETVLKYARENNPDIKAARQKYLASKERIIRVRTLADPSVNYETDSFLKMDMYGVSQEVPLGGKLRLRAKIAKYESETVKNRDYLAVEREVLAKVKHTYFLLLAAEKTVVIYKETAAILKNIIKAAEAKYIVGKANQSDILRAQIELSKTNNMLLVMNQEKESMTAMLNSLLSRGDKEQFGSPVEPEKLEFAYSFDSLQELAIENRPELKGAKSLVEKHKAASSLAKREFIPDLMLGYKKQKMQTSGDFVGDIGMVSFNLPLWFWKQAAMVREAGKESLMAESEYLSMENMTYYDIKNLFTKTTAFLQIVKQYKSAIIPLARQNLEISEASYRADKMDFLDLLDSQRMLLELQVEYYQHLASYIKYLSELEQVTGKELN